MEFPFMIFVNWKRRFLVDLNPSLREKREGGLGRPPIVNRQAQAATAAAILWNVELETS